MNQKIDKETLEKLRDGAQGELDYEKEHGSDRHESKDIPFWIGFWSGKVDAYQYLLDIFILKQVHISDVFEEVTKKMVEEKQKLEDNLSDAKVIIQTIDKYISLLEELKILSLSLKEDFIKLEDEVKKAKEK